MVPLLGNWQQSSPCILGGDVMSRELSNIGNTLESKHCGAVRIKKRLRTSRPG
jgi:hypothetical protein